MECEISIFVRKRSFPIHPDGMLSPLHIMKLPRMVCDLAWRAQRKTSPWKEKTEPFGAWWWGVGRYLMVFLAQRRVLCSIFTARPCFNGSPFQKYQKKKKHETRNTFHSPLRWCGQQQHHQHTTSLSCVLNAAKDNRSPYCLMIIIILLPRAPKGCV